MVSITVFPAGKLPSFARGLPTTIQVPSSDSIIADVKQSITARFPKFHTSRQKITLRGDQKHLRDDTKLKDLGIVDGSQLAVKDLGLQINWTTVFVIEYLGPLVMHPLFYYLPKLIYGRDVEHSLLQKYVFAMVMLHFAKRELETLFLHRFSHATMPAYLIVKNSFHYHVLSGLFLAYDVYRPAFSASSPYIVTTIRDDPRFLWVCSSVWFFAELSNFHTHLTLRALRPVGSHKRAIPHGYGFSLVSCPNYMFEILAWIIICAMTGSYAAWLFTVVAIGQMIIWALKKHANYKKEFGKQYPRRRMIMIPFIF